MLQKYASVARHVALVDAMADLVGIDLEEAVLAGRINFDEIADAVLRCTGCVKVEDCEALVSLGSVTEVPGYCRNADLFRDLGGVS